MIRTNMKFARMNGADFVRSRSKCKNPRPSSGNSGGQNNQFWIWHSVGLMCILIWMWITLRLIIFLGGAVQDGISMSAEFTQITLPSFRFLVLARDLLGCTERFIWAIILIWYGCIFILWLMIHLLVWRNYLLRFWAPSTGWIAKSAYVYLFLSSMEMEWCSELHHLDHLIDLCWA